MLAFVLLITDGEYRLEIEKLYRKYHVDMLRFAMSRLRLRGDKNYQINAQDVVQNAFVKITKYAHAIRFGDGEKGVRAYLFSIVANEIADFLADRHVPEEWVEDIAEEDFFGKLRIQERYNTVVEAIGALEERYSIVLLLRYRQECSVSDISEILGIPEKSVYTRLARGKKRLLTLLQEREV